MMAKRNDIRSAFAVDVSVVIVNWNSCDYLRRCLKTLFQHRTTLELEVIVIDSASYDGCEVMLRSCFPTVDFIQSPDNLGFARANNRAARKASGESLLFLNPDTSVEEPAIDRLFEALRSLDRAGAVGARLLNDDGSVQRSCVQALPTITNQLLDSELLQKALPRSRLWGNAVLCEESDQPRDVEAVSGACLMLPRCVFDEIGGFNEEYFMYAEDLDLCHRVRLTGRRVYHVPKAVVTHYGGASSGRAVSGFSAAMMREANWRFLSRTRGRLYASGYRVAMFVTAASRLALLSAAMVRTNDDQRGRMRAALAKWNAVLRWSLGRAETVGAFYEDSSRR